MIVPFAHLDELQKLPVEAAHEMMDCRSGWRRVLRQLYTPDGINLGMNIGKAAGAGVAGHIHMHVLPRWVADANFMSVVGETRMLPETLEVTWGRIREAMSDERQVTHQPLCEPIKQRSNRRRSRLMTTTVPGTGSLDLMHGRVKRQAHSRSHPRRLRLPIALGT